MLARTTLAEEETLVPTLGVGNAGSEAQPEIRISSDRCGQGRGGITVESKSEIGFSRAIAI